MRSKLVQGRKSINRANSVLPAYILNPREMVPENLADTRFCVQVDTTPKATIPLSTQQVARYNRVLNRTAVMLYDRSSYRRGVRPLFHHFRDTTRSALSEWTRECCGTS